jgi:tetrahydromethanopterin S-methyltransferase subunit G
MVDIQCSFQKAGFDKVMKRLDGINEKTIKTEG